MTDWGSDMTQLATRERPEVRIRPRDDQPLAAVLADPSHLAAAAGAERALGLDHLGAAHDMFRQAEPGAGRAPPPAAGRDPFVPAVFGGRLDIDLGRRDPEVLERQLAIVGRELLGLLAEQELPELVVEMLEATDLFGKVRVLGSKPRRLGCKALGFSLSTLRALLRRPARRALLVQPGFHLGKGRGDARHARRPPQVGHRERDVPDTEGTGRIQLRAQLRATTISRTSLRRSPCSPDPDPALRRHFRTPGPTWSTVMRATASQPLPPARNGFRSAGSQVVGNC